MKNVERLRDTMKNLQNSGSQIGDFLLGHTNNSFYLVSQLEAYLEAAKADLENERKLARQFAQALKQ